MYILWVILIGLVIGAIARLLMPGADPGGWIFTIVLGIAGSFVGTFLGRLVGLYGPGQTAGFIGSVVGAVVILAVYKAVRR
jgi:uncharacterized membrane protein YeaQ/YmgE (transglycosylase-associated protein family)